MKIVGQHKDGSKYAAIAGQLSHIYVLDGKPLWGGGEVTMLYYTDGRREKYLSDDEIERAVGQMAIRKMRKDQARACGPLSDYEKDEDIERAVGVLILQQMMNEQEAEHATR